MNTDKQKQQGVSQQEQSSPANHSQHTQDQRRVADLFPSNLPDHVWEQIYASMTMLDHFIQGGQSYEEFLRILKEDSTKATPPLYCRLLPLWFGRRGTELSRSDHQELRTLALSWIERDREDLQVQQTTSVVRNLLAHTETTTQMAEDLGVIRVQSTATMTAVLCLLILITVLVLYRRK